MNMARFLLRQDSVDKWWTMYASFDTLAEKLNFIADHNEWFYSKRVRTLKTGVKRGKFFRATEEAFQTFCKQLFGY